MKANIHFRSYIAKFLLKWEAFQVKVVEETKCAFHVQEHFFFFPKNHSIFENNVEEHCRSRQASDDNIDA